MLVHNDIHQFCHGLWKSMKKVFFIIKLKLRKLKLFCNTKLCHHFETNPIFFKNDLMWLTPSWFKLYLMSFACSRSNYVINLPRKAQNIFWHSSSFQRLIYFLWTIFNQLHFRVPRWCCLFQNLMTWHKYGKIRDDVMKKMSTWREFGRKSNYSFRDWGEVKGEDFFSSLND